MTARDGRPRSEKRQRNRTVLVRMNEAEYQALTAAMTRTAKGASTLLREAFLYGDDEATIRADERERSAFLLRSLFPPDFLKRHGLHPRASTRDILDAAA